MNKILVVEDADSLREVLVSVLEEEGFKVSSATSAESASLLAQRETFDCILSDFKLPQKNGLDLLGEVRAISPTVPFLMMTAYGTIDIAVEAMKLGANDFLCKPFEPETLSSAVRQVIQHRQVIDRRSGLRLRRQRHIISRDPEIQGILHQARKVAAVDTSALILGQSGTGKELLARYIHEHSQRKDKPFLAINCAALPAGLLESEFFGHEAGAFTGATQSRAGVFEVASGGTVFLDEIGEMPPALQVKLLRAIQEREIKRVGGMKSIKVNPRILAATNQNIEKALSEGILREDLYYRLAVVSFTIPPLRERHGDVELLVDYFLEFFSTELRKPVTLSTEARKILTKYSWPGNARELENVMERAVILADQTILPEHLGINFGIDFSSLEELKATTLPEIAQLAARRAETEVIRKVLDKTKGNKSRAAELLGVSYKTLLNKIKEYELDKANSAGVGNPLH